MGGVVTRTKPSINYAKRKAFALALSLLIYPRLISFESDRGSGSTRQGWCKERCQPGMAVCASYFHDRSQDAAGTRRAELSQNDFLLPFLVFKNEGPRQGCCCRKYLDTKNQTLMHLLDESLRCTTSATANVPCYDNLAVNSLLPNFPHGRPALVFGYYILF